MAFETEHIMRPEELPFEVPRILAESINDLIDAIDRDDQWLDAYFDEVQSNARMLPEDEDRFVADYYCFYGWREALPRR